MAKRKRHEVDSDTASASVDLTALNAVNSPLLRLPVELRDIIWQYAFGDTMAMVESRSKLTFRAAIYNVVCEEEDIATTAELSTAPGPVSRQFWAETFPVFVSTCTFRFDSTDVFKKFAVSSLPIVSLVNRIMITSLNSCWRDWWELNLGSKDITWSTVGLFKSLEGVRFVADRFPPCYEVCDHSDDLEFDDWQQEMPIAIRAFQQHRLKPEYTSVHLERNWYNQPSTYYLPDWDLGPFEESIRKQLLDHKPRRLSKRISQRTKTV